MARIPHLQVAVVCFSFAIAVCAEPERNSPKFKVTSKRDHDRIEVIVNKAAVTFAIQSPFGISEATVERIADRWPEKVTLNLYLKGLEKFSISNGKLRISASVSSGTPKTVRIWKNDAEDTLLSSSDRDWMPVIWIEGDAKAKDKRRQTGFFSIQLPDSLFAENSVSITLSWIDFYRT